MRTKALLIGIQYGDSKEYTEADGPQYIGKEKWDDLDGPHNDVNRMKSFLVNGPWQYGQIRILLDKPGFMRPNRENIIQSLYWLTDNATEEHRLFLHYSGHGSQAGTDSPSEPDGYDETLVPVDCPPSDTDEGVQGMIRDNELREILVDRLPIGCHLTALFDCCHSGSILDLRHCYPRYLSIPYAWYTSGPAHAHPRLNRNLSSQTSAKSSTLPPSFENHIPPDLEDLQAPLPGCAVPMVYPNTPTPMNPHGIELPDPAEFDSPVIKNSFIMASAEDTPVTAGLSNMFRRVSLREQRMGSKLNRVFSRRQSRQMSISKGLALSAAPGILVAADPEFSPKMAGHLRKMSGGSGGRKESIGFGLRVMHSTTTVASNIHMAPTAEQLGLGLGQKKQLSMHAIDAWRASIAGGSVPVRIDSQGFIEDAFLCEEQTLSPTSTISALPMRRSFQLQRSSVIQGMVNQALRTGEQQVCYENPDVPSPFQTLQYEKPIRSRATFHGFHMPPLADGPSPRVSSFSACYDDQAVFETGNGDGLLTSAFIKCMTDHDHEVTYGDMMAEMKKFFVRTNAERDVEDQFSLPPFPMLSSSYPIDLQNKVII